MDDCDAVTSDRTTRVCAVIVHHRGRRLLARCLESLLAARGVVLEVVVVANACDEELPEIVERSPRIHVVHSRRSLGFSAANNLGAAWVKESLEAVDYLFFVNNDTLTEVETLERLAADLERHPDCAIVGPRLMIWGATEVLNSLGLNVTRTGEAWDEGIGRPLREYLPLPERRHVTAVTGAALMIRATAFESLGGWEDLYVFYFEDIDLCLRARAAGWDVVVVTEAVVRHAISATAARGSDLKRQLSWRNRFLLMLIHWPWSLLATAGPRTLWSESALALRRLRAGARADLILQLRSWSGAIKRLPKVFRARRSLGRDRSWTEHLRPHGSVPVISLPELPQEAVLGLDSGSV